MKCTEHKYIFKDKKSIKIVEYYILNLALHLSINFNPQINSLQIVASQILSIYLQAFIIYMTK